MALFALSTGLVKLELAPKARDVEALVWRDVTLVVLDFFEQEDDLVALARLGRGFSWREAGERGYRRVEPAFEVPPLEVS